MTVRQYSHLDPDAPVLTQGAGKFIELLDAVLVNGYGSQPPLGWTKEFSGTNIAVYRNDPTVPGSTGMYLRVDDINSSYAQVSAYKTMSDINTGTDRIPNPSQYSQTAIYWHKLYSGNGTKRWMIIGDERTFYGYNSISGSYPTDDFYYSNPYGVGDFISYVPSNVWNYMLFGSGSSSSSSTQWFPYSVGSSGGYTAHIGRAQDLVVDKSSRIDVPFFRSGASSNPAFSPYTGLVHMTPAYIYEYAAMSSVTGEFRGVLYHYGRSTDTQFENFGKKPGDPAGPDYIQFNGFTSSNSSMGNLLIANSGEWDG